MSGAEHTHAAGLIALNCPACMATWLSRVTEPRRRIPTPFPALSRALDGGFDPGALVFIGGLSTTGKSLLGLNLVQYAVDLGHTAGILSYEMRWEDWVRRALARLNVLTARELRRPEAVAEAGEALLERLTGAYHDGGSTLYLVGRAQGRLAELDQDVRLLREAGIGLLLVDYVQLVRTRGGHGGRFAEIEDVVQRLKEHADAGLVVIGVSQLHRATHDSKPHIGNFYGASAIEHAADAVILLDHTGLEDRAGDRIVPAWLAKNRHGEEWPTWKLRLDKASLEMTELCELHETRTPWTSKSTADSSSSSAQPSLLEARDG